MARRLLRMGSWLVFSFQVCSCSMLAQSSATPIRTIPLPPACRHPFRDLYQYGSEKRFGLKNKSVFCRIGADDGKVNQFDELGEIESATPAPKGFLVAVVNSSNRLTVLDDEGHPQFVRKLDSSSGPAMYWSSDESHLIVFSFPGESEEAESATIIDIQQRTMKRISLNPAASVSFDAKTDQFSALQENGKVVRATVYDLDGRVLRREVVQKTQREHIDSASGKYYYIPHHEVGEGDTVVHLSASGNTLVRVPENKPMGSRRSDLWDNPEWNPADDDLLLLLYISMGSRNEKDLTEIDVFSISKGKPIRVFPLGEKGTPAYGWTADGKQVVLCDLDCSFYSMP